MESQRAEFYRCFVNEPKVTGGKNLSPVSSYERVGKIFSILAFKKAWTMSKR